MAKGKKSIFSVRIAGMKKQNGLVNALHVKSGIHL